MQFSKVTILLVAAACGLGAASVLEEAKKLIRCGGWHPVCYCTIKSLGVKDRWQVKEKCVSSGKGHNFDPCMVYYNPDATREAWCCEAGFQPELNMPGGHALSTSVMKHNCKRRNPQ